MVMTDCNPLRGISPRFLPLCTLRNWCLEHPRFLSQRPPSLTTQHVWTALRGLGLLTAGRVRAITAASSWRPASTQRRRRTRPDAHGDVVGTPLACHVRYTPWRGCPHHHARRGSSGRARSNGSALQAGPGATRRQDAGPASPGLRRSFSMATVLDGVNHIAIVTRDMDRFIHFYREAFDATLVRQRQPAQLDPWL